MADPLDLRDELADALELAADQAQQYLSGIDTDRVLDGVAAERLADWGGPLPDDGTGAPPALAELAERPADGDPLQRATVLSLRRRRDHARGAGCRLAHVGVRSDGVQLASSPLAVRLETIAVDWLRELFELPTEFGGVLVTGATMANFTGLAAARGWWAERRGIDVDEQGVTGIEPPVILSSGYIHASAMQAIGMLGLGRANVRRLARDGVGRLDLEALERELASAGGGAIVIANAGEVNAGDFDPLAEIAELPGQRRLAAHRRGVRALRPPGAGDAPLTEGVEQANPSRWTPTNGSTSRMTAASRSYASRCAWRGRSTSAPRTCPRPRTPAPTRAS